MMRSRPTLTGARAAATLADIGLANIAGGVILRRKPVVKVLERIQADRRAVNRIQKLRSEFGGAPVELTIPGRRILVLVDPADVERVLAESPSPFDPANREKRKALRPFQPHGVLISRGPIRTERRVVNEAALDTGAPMHRSGAALVRAVSEEAAVLAATMREQGELTSPLFEKAWWRVIRRVVLGDRARDDGAITDDLRRLRSSGNWSFAALPHPARTNRFLERLSKYAEQPEPDSLLGALADSPVRAGVDPVGQVPQWLFAFDAAGMATIRALALLATHPRQRAHVETEAPRDLALRPYLRGCVLESVRLWPTTPVILRDTAGPTEWGTGSDRFVVDSGTAVVICVPAFHRDADLVPFAHDFAPEVWTDGRAQSHPQLVPFSAGPVECPGRNVVLLTASTMLANLLCDNHFELRSAQHLVEGQPLPMTFDQYSVKLGVSPARVHR